MSRKPIDHKAGVTVILSKDEKLRAKVHAIFKINGFSPLTNSTCNFKQWHCVNTLLGGGFYQGCNVDSRFGRMVSTEEFIAEYGEKEDVATGPELTGPIIPFGSKFYRAVSEKKGWVSDEGVACVAGDAGHLSGESHGNVTLYAIAPPKLNRPYQFQVCRGSGREEFAVYVYAWIEVPAPEGVPLKEYTQEELVKLVGHEFKLKVVQ